MTTRVQGHFDGTFVVLDEPADVPVGSRVTVEMAGYDESAAPLRDDRICEAMARLARRGQSAPEISLESLRRENMYGDEGR